MAAALLEEKMVEIAHTHTQTHIAQSAHAPQPDQSAQRVAGTWPLKRFMWTEPGLRLVELSLHYHKEAR